MVERVDETHVESERRRSYCAALVNRVMAGLPVTDSEITLLPEVEKSVLCEIVDEHLAQMRRGIWNKLRIVYSRACGYETDHAKTIEILGVLKKKVRK